MKPAAAGADPAFQARMAIVIRHLLEAVDEIALTEQELVDVCGFMDRIAETHEWRFLTHIFGVDTLAAEITHGGEGRRTADNVEGPLHRPGAPEAPTPALIMRPDEKGERLFLTGAVVSAATGAALPHAVVDVWQSSVDGAYAEDDPTQPEWNFRRRVIADAAGRYAIETVVPGEYEIGDLSGMASGDLMKRLGRHGMRPGHIHFKISAAGALPLTTLIYFEGSPWVEDDSIFSVRPDVTVRLSRHEDADEMAARGLNAPFQTAEFTFALEPSIEAALQDA